MSHRRNRNVLGAAPRPITVPLLPIADSIMAEQVLSDSADSPSLPSRPDSLHPHPLAGLFPMMQGAEFERFRAALQSDGRLLEEIVLFEDPRRAESPAGMMASASVVR